jgi:hypothetical protein
MSIVPADFSRLSVVVSEARSNTPRNRNPEEVIKAVLKYADSDLHFAIGCIYAIPRGGRVIRGPSVRLAELLRYVWGGIWLEAVDVVEHNDHVVAKVVGVDTVNGNLTCEIVPERIVHRDGRRYDVDGILNAKRAALAKAKRNVILDLIPANLVSNRIVVGLRARLTAKRREIETEYNEAIAELARKFRRSVDQLQSNLASQLNVQLYEDPTKNVLSTDFMLTVIEYANALQDLIISVEPSEQPGQQQQQPQPQIQAPTIDDNHVNTDAFILQPEPVPEPQPHMEPQKKVRPIRR